MIHFEYDPLTSKYDILQAIHPFLTRMHEPLDMTLHILR